MLANVVEHRSNCMGIALKLTDSRLEDLHAVDSK